MGDGSTHTLDSNWSAQLQLQLPRRVRFLEHYQLGIIYNYSLGHWWGYDIHVGPTEFDHWVFSAAFIGDGVWHDVGVLYNDTHWH